MKLHSIDFVIIAAYFAVAIGVSMSFSRRAKRSMLDYFVSHRSMPWWLAGTAMVATTFSADTPLAVTEMVVKNGVAGNWIWWYMLASGVLTVFFFAKLWRRAEIVTDVELTEMRYSGKPAAFLRGFRAAYLSLMVNIIIMGWVNLGMSKVLGGTLGISKWAALLICLLITFFYTMTSGYWGITMTHGLQYCFEMGGAIILAVVSVGAVGGVSNMLAKLGTAHPAGTPPGTIFGNAHWVISFWPTGNQIWMLPTLTVAALLGINWWASWYPGAEPGGGGYVVQNMLACKDEREARLAALFFNIAHYALRSWPWVITALCSLAIYQGSVRTVAGTEDPGLNYVHMMVDFLPVGLRGLMLAAFAAAYSSTQATQMNWGSSYLVNDLYRRFIRKDASEPHYVLASRLATLLTLILSLVATYFMDQISQAWELLMMLGAGTGLVYILRWYWWRINAWSEVSAMASAFMVSMALRFVGKTTPVLDTSTASGFALNLIVTTIITTIVWITVTLLTPPEPAATLQPFYLKVRPAGPGWGPVARATGVAPPRGEIGRNLVMWVAGILFVYSIMFGTGSLLFNERGKLLVFVATMVLSGLVMFGLLNREKSDPTTLAAVAEERKTAGSIIES
jgi:SSS family solute:Na+ symporter